MLRIGDHRELQAAVLALKAMDRDLDRDIRRDTVATMNPEWKSVVQQNAHTPMDALVIGKGSRIAGGNPPAAVAASSTKRRSGGLVPVEDWAAWEFGANRNRRTTYRRRNRRGPGTHRVTRHTTRQLPARDANGRVAYPSFAQIGPRLVSLWVQTIVRKVHDALEGR